MKQTCLNIYGYTDFRLFIEDRLNELKSHDRRYSRRWFCRRLGLSSTNYLKRIIDGSRRLSDDLGARLSVELGLNREERAFFKDLVDYGQARDTEMRSEALQRLRRHKRFIAVHMTDLDHYDYLTDPLCLALREMITFPDFKEDIAWIARRLSHDAGEAEIRAALKRLERLGLVLRDEQGKLAVADKHLATGPQFGSVKLRTYHRNMLKLGAASIELPVQTRYFNGLTLAVKAASYEKILERYRRFLNEVRSIADADTDCDSVYHLHTTLYPLSRPIGEGEEDES